MLHKIKTWVSPHGFVFILLVAGHCRVVGGFKVMIGQEELASRGAVKWRVGAFDARG
jgi:hypothetical protein